MNILEFMSNSPVLTFFIFFFLTCMVTGVAGISSNKCHCCETFPSKASRPLD